jgi:hypothetical protein
MKPVVKELQLHAGVSCMTFTTQQSALLDFGVYLGDAGPFSDRVRDAKRFRRRIAMVPIDCAACTSRSIPLG